jgi:delta1-piperideine-2-carboxylate reductase
MRLSIDDARELAIRATAALGYDEDEATIVGEHLLDAAMRGFDRFGLPRVLAIAEGKERAGGIGGSVEIVAETANSVQIDGHGKVGYVVAYRATEAAIRKAAETGVGIAGATNTRYTGLLSYYCEMAAAHGFVTICASSAHTMVAPHGAREPRLGTNPIAISFPGPEQPVIWDIGTSAMMYGDVWLRARRGEELPAGVAVDHDGRETTDPREALNGAIRVWGGHRGSGLSTMVQLFGILAGPNGIQADGGGDYGFFIMVLNPDKLALTNIPTLVDSVGRFGAHFKTAKPAEDGNGGPRMPFERSAALRRQIRDDGVELPDDVFEDLAQLASQSTQRS